MTIHREHRDFSVLMETVDQGQPERTVLGRGGAIRPGHVIEMVYRGLPERGRVRSIEATDYGTWRAVVTPIPVLPSSQEPLRERRLD